MVKEIILVRHGETDWNLKEVFRGTIDIDLNETGLREAELLGKYLSNINIGSIYSSPLRRALKTAELIACHHKLAVEIAPELRDLDFGKWQGLTHQEVIDKYKKDYDMWVKRPELVKIPSGESLDEARERSLNLIYRVILGKEDRIVIVSHRVIIKIIICALLGLDNSHFWNIKVDTCGITNFGYENDRFILIKHNDTSFLKPLQKKTLTDF